NSVLNRRKLKAKIWIPDNYKNVNKKIEQKVSVKKNDRNSSSVWRTRGPSSTAAVDVSVSARILCAEQSVLVKPLRHYRIDHLDRFSFSILKEHEGQGCTIKNQSMHMHAGNTTFWSGRFQHDFFLCFPSHSVKLVKDTAKHRFLHVENFLQKLWIKNKERRF
ncbi:hypothetical protein ACJX0J_006094, partial [Zea mays]